MICLQRILHLWRSHDDIFPCLYHLSWTSFRSSCLNLFDCICCLVSFEFTSSFHSLLSIVCLCCTSKYSVVKSMQVKYKMSEWDSTLASKFYLNTRTRMNSLHKRKPSVFGLKKIEHKDWEKLSLLLFPSVMTSSSTSRHWREEESLFQEIFLGFRITSESSSSWLSVSMTAMMTAMMMCWRNWKGNCSLAKLFNSRRRRDMQEEGEVLFCYSSWLFDWHRQTAESVLNTYLRWNVSFMSLSFLSHSVNSLSFVSNCLSFASCVTRVSSLERLEKEWKNNALLEDEEGFIIMNCSLLQLEEKTRNQWTYCFWLNTMSQDSSDVQSLLLFPILLFLFILSSFVLPFLFWNALCPTLIVESTSRKRPRKPSVRTEGAINHRLFSEGQVFLHHERGFTSEYMYNLNGRTTGGPRVVSSLMIEVQDNYIWTWERMHKFTAEKDTKRHLSDDSLVSQWVWTDDAFFFLYSFLFSPHTWLLSSPSFFCISAHFSSSETDWVTRGLRVTSFQRQQNSR